MSQANAENTTDVPDMSSLGRLVPVTEANVGGASVPTCNARDLHAYLKVGRDFSNWIKARIAKYGFAVGVDYVTEARSPNLASGNRGASLEYHLALDMAKEIAMVENNDAGRQARRYFIECERHLFSPISAPIIRPLWADRSNEDRRVELETIATYRRCCSTAAAWWYALEQAGLPVPPRALQPAWRQAELMQIETVSVTTWTTAA